MNKRVTILTFHFNQNYGAVLQAYALQQFLKTNKFLVSFPAYIPEYMVPSSALLRGIKSGGKIRMKLVLQKLRTLPRRLRFQNFRKKYMSINHDAKTLEQSLKLQRDSYAVICGSDQVWNLNWHLENSFDSYYFMEQIHNSSCKKISYAACFGKKQQPVQMLNLAAKQIAAFDAVFSRNQLTKEVVESVTDRNVPLVVDPTLLPDITWPIREVPAKQPPYILLYSIDEGQSAMAEAILQQLRAIADIPIIQICSENAHLIPGCQRYEKSGSPEDWLELIHNAEYVVTDSFHGCVFSLKFGRKLVAYAEDWRAERMQDLLDRVGLGHFLLTSPNHIERITDSRFFEFDASNVASKLREMGSASAAQLLNALSNDS